MSIQIPAKKNIQPTNQEDPLRYYYLPVGNKKVIS